MNDENMRVTVAIPVYNAGKFLKEAVLSIIQQTKAVDEILIVDDCSTDNSYEIAIGFKNQFDNITVIRNSNNLGYAKNWNKCLEKASNRFVLLLHHDDLLKPGAIKILFDFFKTHPELALVGGQEDYFEDGKDSPQNTIVKRKDTYIFNQGEIYEFIKETGSYISCSSVMFDMGKIRNVGFFDEDYLATDELYWPRVLKTYPIAVLGSTIINRRKHEGQTEYGDFINKRQEIIAWIPQFQKICEYETRNTPKKLLINFINKRIAYTLLGIAYNVALHFKQANIIAYYYFKSFKYYPLLIVEKRFWKITVKTILKFLNIL